MAQWALMKRDGEERIEGLVSFYSPTLHLASMLPLPSQLIDYLYSPVATSSYFTDEQGKNLLDHTITIAKQQGLQLERYAEQQRVVEPTTTTEEIEDDADRAGE